MCSLLGVAKCLDKLKQAKYPNYNMTPDETKGVADLWMQVLEDIDDNTLMAAVLLVITEARAFAPSVGEVRGACIRIMVKASGIPDAYQAYMEVVTKPTQGEKDGEFQLLDNNTWGYPRKPVQFSSPIVEAVAYMMGWPKTFPTDNPMADRSQFTKAFEQEARRSIEDSTRLPAIQQYIEQISASGNLPKLLTNSPSHSDTPNQAMKSLALKMRRDKQ